MVTITLPWFYCSQYNDGQYNTNYGSTLVLYANCNHTKVLLWYLTFTIMVPWFYLIFRTNSNTNFSTSW